MPSPEKKDATMTDSLDIYATPQQLVQLADVAKCSPGPLSPIPAMKKSIARKSKKSLPKEWLQKKDQLKPEIAAMVQGISAATSFTFLEFLTKKKTYHTSVYYSGTTMDSGFSLTDTGDQVRIQKPAVMEAAVDLISLHTGESLLNRLGWDMELDIDDALILLAIIDGARRKTLNALLGSAPDLLISLKDIQQSLKTKKGGRQWLSGTLGDSLGLKIPGREKAQESLKRLENKKLITRKGKKWQPGEMAGTLVSELLLLDSHINLRSVTTLENNELGMTEIHVASGFANAHLLWSRGEETVKMVGLSSMELLAMLYDMIRPGIKKMPDRGSEVEKQGPEEKRRPSFCRQCGAELAPDDKFCTKCGQAR